MQIYYTFVWRECYESRHNKYIIFFMFTYKELKFDKKKREAFRAMLPYNYASLLYRMYHIEAIKTGKEKAEFSYSLIRKVAAGKRQNEKILQDLIKIAKQFQEFQNQKNKFKKDGTVSL